MKLLLLCSSCLISTDVPLLLPTVRAHCPAVPTPGPLFRLWCCQTDVCRLTLALRPMSCCQETKKLPQTAETFPTVWGGNGTSIPLVAPVRVVIRLYLGGGGNKHSCFHCWFLPLFKESKRILTGDPQRWTSCAVRVVMRRV